MEGLEAETLRICNAVGRWPCEFCCRVVSVSVPDEFSGVREGEVDEDNAEEGNDEEGKNLHRKRR